MTNRININGSIITGGNINISGNGKIVIDGVDVTDQIKQTMHGDRPLIQIQGDVQTLVVEQGDAEVSGEVHGTVAAGGSVTCHSVGGDVDAGGSVKCDDVAGGINAGGSIKCGKVSGDANAGGSIKIG